MKRLSIFVLAVAVTGLMASVASAQTSRMDRREARQQWRIHDGIRDGELTRSEQRRLRAIQRRIRIMERRAWADGHLSRTERIQINRARNQASRMIYQMKHDRDRYADGRWSNDRWSDDRWLNDQRSDDGWSDDRRSGGGWE